MAIELKPVASNVTRTEPDIAEAEVVNNAEVNRNFNTLSTLSLAVSLMATWETVCSTIGSGLVSGGPVSLSVTDDLCTQVSNGRRTVPFRGPAELFSEQSCMELGLWLAHCAGVVVLDCLRTFRGRQSHPDLLSHHRRKSGWHECLDMRHYPVGIGRHHRSHGLDVSDSLGIRPYGAPPFSHWLSQISPRFKVPTNSVICVFGLLAIIGLLNIVSTTAFTAVLSLAVENLALSYLNPIVMLIYRRIRFPEDLVYGPWKLPNIISLGSGFIAVIYNSYICIFLIFPPFQPVTAQNMNYARVVLGGVLLFGGDSLVCGCAKVLQRSSGTIIDNTMYRAIEEDGQQGLCEVCKRVCLTSTMW
ncbi:hypothetical protein LA080_001168 [Diaporthe eres]|nr:hypothetical protein LA080_001168 [Diaporthe eres]